MTKGYVLDFNNVINNLSIDYLVKQYGDKLSPTFSEIEHFTKQTQKPILKFDSFPNFITSINEEISKQENFCDQYRLLLDNKNQIIEQIKTIDEKNNELYDNYLTLGKILSFLSRSISYSNSLYSFDSNM